MTNTATAERMACGSAALPPISHHVKKVMRAMAASAHHTSSFANQICLLLALANLLYCGKQFYISAWKQLLHHTTNMDSLVALSTLIAFLFSTFNTFFGEMVWGARGIEWHTYFDASVMIITFVLTGRGMHTML